MYRSSVGDLRPQIATIHLNARYVRPELIVTAKVAISGNMVVPPVMKVNLHYLSSGVPSDVEERKALEKWTAYIVSDFFL